MTALVDIGAGIGRFMAAGLACAIIGAICGAILGGVAGIPFSLFGGPIIGVILGGIGGLVAGFIGGMFGGSPGFRVGGIVGAIVLTTVFPYIVFAWFLPPALALTVGFLFGKFLDAEVKQPEPKFALVGFLGEVLAPLAVYPERTRKICGIVSSVVVIACVALWMCCYL